MSLEIPRHKHESDRVLFEAPMHFNFHRGPRNRGPAAIIFWSWSAAVIDAGFIVGFSLLILFATSVFGHLAFSQLILFMQSNRLQVTVWVGVGFSFTYMLMLRSFLGFSLGEWACGLRLGSLRQRLSSLYVIQVLFRTTLVFATGIVLLPVLSLLLKRDTAGQISGLRILSVK